MGVKGKSKEASILSDVDGGSFRVFKQSLPAEDNNWKVKSIFAGSSEKKPACPSRMEEATEMPGSPLLPPLFPPLSCPWFSPLFLSSLLSSLLRKFLLLLRGAFLGL